jgi:hypothetical protein
MKSGWQWQMKKCPAIMTEGQNHDSGDATILNKSPTPSLNLESISQDR